jgi:tetratricopeptide (TPR) repeat protein
VAGEAVVVCQIVTGLGGVGKTQLAAELAHRCWEEQAVDLLVWVTAGSRTSIITAYARAAAEVTGVEDEDLEQAAARLLGWLASTDRPWLIVLDDLSDPAHLRDLWPPGTPVGRTVVTTRRRDTALLASRQVVSVGLFTPGEACTYLRHKLVAHPGLLDGADELAADLGYLPLGLAQAAAYLLDRRLSCAAYRARLADRRRQLSDLLPEVGGLPDEHQATVAVTWALSIELADTLKPVGLARPLIELAALLDPNGIPAAVFPTEAVGEYVSARVGRPVNGEDVVDGLHALHRLSLFTAPDTGREIDADNDMVRVHALVQRAVREANPAERLPELADVAASALLAVWPEIDYATTGLIAALRANTTTLAGNAGDLLWHPGIHPLLYRAGVSLGNAGLHTTAVAYWQRMTDQAVRQFGDEDGDTISVQTNLAASYARAGRISEAITLQEQVLTDSARLFGKQHPDTLRARGHLAASYAQAGRTAEAIGLEEQVLIDRVRLFGKQHPDTLRAQTNLAASYQRAGLIASAIILQEQVVTGRVRVLGDEHPDTLNARSSLALLYAAVGRTAEAITLRGAGPHRPGAGAR